MSALREQTELRRLVRRQGSVIAQLLDRIEELEGSLAALCGEYDEERSVKRKLEEEVASSPPSPLVALRENEKFMAEMKREEEEPFTYIGIPRPNLGQSKVK